MAPKSTSALATTKSKAIQHPSTAQHSVQDAAPISSMTTGTLFSKISPEKACGCMALMLRAAMRTHPSSDVWILAAHAAKDYAKRAGVTPEEWDVVIELFGKLSDGAKDAWPKDFF